MSVLKNISESSVCEGKEPWVPFPQTVLFLKSKICAVLLLNETMWDSRKKEVGFYFLFGVCFYSFRIKNPYSITFSFRNT